MCRYLIWIGFSLAVGSAVVSAKEPGWIEAPLGLRKLPFPEDNPLTPEKVRLGKQLFFDPRLSSDNTVSCATCHDPAKGWSNGERFASGVNKKIGTRSALALINVAYQKHLFWDGRASSLEEQTRQPIENPSEMNMPLEELAGKLNQIPGYREQFQNVYGADATPETIPKPLAAFVRTILSGDAPFDRYRAGDLGALSPAARRGHDVFFFRMNCRACHQGVNFTDGGFHNVGIGVEQPNPDVGRRVVTQEEVDTGKFRTPTLREIARTAPYMHDGRFQTLKDVVDHYATAGVMNDHLDELMNVFPLSDQEKADLVVFLEEGLSSDSYPLVKPPKLPQ